MTKYSKRHSCPSATLPSANSVALSVYYEQYYCNVLEAGCFPAFRNKSNIVINLNQSR
jgi:hypothetical protein